MTAFISTKLDLLILDLSPSALSILAEPHYRSLPSRPSVLFYRLTPHSFSRLARVVRLAWPKIAIGERAAVERSMKRIKECALEIFTVDELKAADLSESASNTKFEEEMSEREIGFLWRSK